MPTVESDVAFGLGKFNLTRDEVKSRVSRSLESVGMLSYQQVCRITETRKTGQLIFCIYFIFSFFSCSLKDMRWHLIFVTVLSAVGSNSQRGSEAEGRHSWSSS